MISLLERMNEAAGEAFAAAGYPEVSAKVTLSNRPDLCEYQCNGALAGAKIYHCAPMKIAQAAAERLSLSPLFASVEAASPGFLNLTLAPEALADTLNQVRRAPQMGADAIGSGKTIILDYGGANVAKPLHVGHLRSAVIGECLKRLSRFLGYRAIGDVHLGDWGLQMGLIIEELRRRQPDLPYFDPQYKAKKYPREAPFTISDLEEIYPAASARSKTDADFAAAAHEATHRLQQGDRGYTALFHHVLNVSKADLRKNYAALNVTFDLWKGESDVQPYIEGMLADLEKKGLLKESQGALVVDVSEPGDTKEVPPCLIRKSDGAYLYATTDLATIVEREKLYHPDEYFYTTDKRQAMHFEQVFRVARKAGIVPKERVMEHLGFGTMNGKDGKPFKTRDGGVMRLEYLLKDITEAVLARMTSQEMSPSEKAKAARIIGLAALKYGDLSNQASKDYVFDIERFSSFEGNTGPYILYTIVRINSILEKYRGGRPGALPQILRPARSQAEKSLQLLLSRAGETLLDAFREKAPHRICLYIYDVSNAFNSFYHETRILTEADGEARKGYIALLALTRRVLTTMIYLLGFSAPDRM